MLLRAHVRPLPEKEQEQLASLQKGTHITLPLLLESGEEVTIEVKVSAVDPTKRALRIEGTTKFGVDRIKAKVTAQIWNAAPISNATPVGIIGYAELIIRSI